MAAPILATEGTDLLIRIALLDADVFRKVGELVLQRFELEATICAAFDEEIAVESRLDLQRNPSGSIEEHLSGRIRENG